MSADSSDPEIQKAITEIKNQNEATNWIVLGYAPKSDTKLVVADKGTGGLSELIELLSPGKVLFGLVAFNINNMKKFAYIAWCGEGVAGMKKGLFNNHSNDAGRLFKGFHVQINARNEDDLKEKDIVGKLTKATGASYDSGAKIQGGSTAKVPTNVNQARELATKSNASVKSVDRSDYNKKDESASYWEKQKEEEKVKPAPVARSTNEYNKTSEREKFWNEEKKEPAPTQKAAVVAPGNASSLKGRFENQQKSEPTPSRPAPSSKPAPSKPAPSSKPAPVLPKATPPPPVQEEEPEPQETYEEPQQTYEEPQQTYEEPYEEPQQTYEEPQQTYEEPQETYEEPQQTYEEPQETYEEPQQNYEEQQTYDNQEQSGVQARALYDFDAENPGDLNFHENDVINILDKSDPSGWWQGELNGVTGFFPSNFVQEL